ncbi:MAG TPA: PhzF family phenazine biosynthesis protein [Solirubrobacteraceae bacterium]|jgi:trans-2,3-dihydro-3-hydroxyanthranilate isomerase|nr:PhzF family phenazine biosynthesis protein [Solirubrobacteraceae bacterium]
MRRYTIADVFTDVPLQGNQVAVFTDATGLSAETMQRAARELNLSETVFVLRSAEPNAHLRVRIFTPTTELPFAGHPILGTAFVVGRAMGSNVVRLETGLGVVAVKLERTDGGAPVYGEMEQFVPEVVPFEAVDELIAALGAAPDHGALPIEAYPNGPLHVYVEFSSEDAVASLRPDMGAIERLGEYGINCFAGSGTRWKTRMFGPALGVPEDPATGSAAGPLAVHLVRYGRVPFGTEIEIVQGVEILRRSVLRARAEGSESAGVERVFVGGSAVVVARGEYLLD